MHFRRHFGGPGHVTVAPGEIVLTDRKATRTVVHRGNVVKVERKRFEPPTGNHWIELTDGELTGYAAISRKRAQLVLDAMTACGFTVQGP
ncbi:MAG: hypothetical protein JWM40_1083 [Frankiales bacterium]|nr:hypothetical protein [Frankiales bacterium]